MSSRSDRHLQREEYPLPDTKEGIKALVGQIFAQEGVVQRMVFEGDDPLVRVHRWVESNPLLEPEVDLDGALRNSQMLEYVYADSSPFAVVWEMLLRLRQERLFPVCWVTGQDQTGMLQAWFAEAGVKGPFDLEEMLGIEVQRTSLLPEETLILAGAAYRDADVKDIKTTIKAAIELKGDFHGDPRRPTSDPVGPRPRERAPAAVQVEAPRPARGDPGWYFRARVGSGGRLR